MNLTTLSSSIALSLLSVAVAQAAVSADEAKALGTTLTGVGADPSASKDGTIPAYSGGQTTLPPGYKAGDPVRPDPFAADKPVATITGANMASYAERLTEGTKAMLKKYADYRVVVYPTRRSVALPKVVVENTAKNAVRAKTIEGGNGVGGAFGGFPFPIPKTGHEAMWNHNLRYSFHSVTYDYEGWMIDANGRPSLANHANYLKEFPYYDPKLSYETMDKEVADKARYIADGPPRNVGAAVMVIEGINPTLKPRRAWQYLPGQRRARAAPDIAFDTPINAASTYDDVQLFNGSLERYDWKLVGKREVYLPYNAYKLVYGSSSAEALKPRFLNPDAVRWELHRAWVVEATLKPGARHIYAKRTFYLDEDSWNALATENYDAGGRLYRTGFSFLAPAYDQLSPYAEPYVIYDLIEEGVAGSVGEQRHELHLDEGGREIAWADSILPGWRPGLQPAQEGREQRLRPGRPADRTDADTARAAFEFNQPRAQIPVSPPLHTSVCPLT